MNRSEMDVGLCGSSRSEEWESWSVLSGLGLLGFYLDLLLGLGFFLVVFLSMRMNINSNWVKGVYYWVWLPANCIINCSSTNRLIFMSNRLIILSKFISILQQLILLFIAFFVCSILESFIALLFIVLLELLLNCFWLFLSCWRGFYTIESSKNGWFFL